MAVGELDGIGMNIGDGVRSTKRGEEFILNLSTGVTGPVDEYLLTDGEVLRRLALVLGKGSLQ